MKQKRYIESLDVLKLIAILIVFNSHCDELYPIPALATGGAIGNSLFFVINGYLLSIKKEQNFWEYYSLKLLRIYPGMLIAAFIYMFAWFKYPTSWSVFRFWFIWPTMFWFGGALVVFYPLFYYLKRLRFERHFCLYTFAVAVIYVVAYTVVIDKNTWSVETGGLISIQGWFKCIHYFYLFSVGYWIKQNDNMRLSPVERNLCFGASATLFIIQIAFKFFMNKYPFLFNFQFMTQLIDICVGILMLIGIINFDEKYKKLVPDSLRAKVKRISNLSFEIYLLQFLFIKATVNLAFPINLGFSLILTFLFGFALNLICNKIVVLCRRDK